jgi:hypothetical protein
MPYNFNDLLNADCRVIKIGNQFVYPIFKVGSNSLFAEADTVFLNNEIRDRCGDIQVLIRDPEKRFISGINYYCQQNNLKVNDTWQLVSQEKLIDRHFAPQYMWLVHLSRFYSGVVTLRPFTDITNFTKGHKGKSIKENLVQVEIIRNLVDIDIKLRQFYNKKIKIKELVRRYKNAMS